MVSRETFKSVGSSSSDEDSNRADMRERNAEQKTRPAEARRWHPFSVEALMSGWKTDDRGGESACCKPEAGSVAVSPIGLNALCPETRSLPGGSRNNTVVPSSPVKSEVSESEDCAPWATKTAFSTQPRKSPKKMNLVSSDCVRAHFPFYFWYIYYISYLLPPTR